MCTPAEDIMAAFCKELHPGPRTKTWINKAEEEGYPQIAKMLRAVVKSEAIRQRSYREVPSDCVTELYDYFVCPQCGLISWLDAPEACPVDGTPGAKFERIG